MYLFVLRTRTRLLTTKKFYFALSNLSLNNEVKMNDKIVKTQQSFID